MRKDNKATSQLDRHNTKKGDAVTIGNKKREGHLMVVEYWSIFEVIRTGDQSTLSRLDFQRSTNIVGSTPLQPD